MIRPQLILDINQELIIDNFAGGGGASTGIELALGRHVDHAINHDAFALGMHRINHPQTVHHCEDVFDIDPLKVTEGRRVGLGWFSPDCKHHSKAKGGKPLDQRIRGLAYVMFRWARIRTRVMIMENVEEIQTWGPLYETHSHGCRGNGKECKQQCHHARPIPEHKGRTWQAFLDVLGPGLQPEHPDLPEMLRILNCRPVDKADGTVEWEPNPARITPMTKAELVQGFGYHTESRELRACDYGTPTIRKRLFKISRCDGLPIVWPAATHYNPKKPTLHAHDAPRSPRLRPWNIIADCIDWHLPCPSIFLTPAEAKKQRCKRPLAKSSLRRIATGMDRYVLKAKEPFTISLTHHGAHRGEKAVVKPEMAPFIGDANRPFKGQTSGPDEPLDTLCAGIKGGHFQLVSGTIVGAGGPTMAGKPIAIDRPGNTVLTDSRMSLAAAHMVRTAHGEVDKNGKKRGRGAMEVTEPVGSTLGTRDVALVTGTLIQTGYGERDGQAPRVPGIDKPLGTAVAGGVKHAVAAASLVKLRGDVDSHGNAPGLDEPGHTASAGGLHHGIAAAYLAQHNTGVIGHDAREPVSTLSAKGSQQQVVKASCINAYYGTEKEGQAMDHPARACTGKPRFSKVDAEAVTPALTPDQIAGALRVAKFLRKFGVEFEGDFATVNVQGIQFVIVDIGMRMLAPRELFRAQGFPSVYVIDRAWIVDPKTGEIEEIQLTKEQQIRMCGNSVVPQIAEALVAANVPELSVWKPKEKRRVHSAPTFV